MCENLEILAASYSNKGYIASFRETDTGSGRRRDRVDARRPKPGRLLGQRDRNPARHEDEPLGRGNSTAGECADELVERIMTSDIFAYGEQAPVGCGPGRRVHRVRFGIQGLA